MNYEIKEETVDKIVDGAEGEETTVYRVYEDGTKEFACSFWKPKETEVVEPEPTEPEPTQLDRIESMVAKSQEEIAQEARDAYTLELIEGGIIV